MKPADYLKNQDYKSLQPSVDGLSELERTIAGYVMVSSAMGRDGLTYQQSAHRPDLKELVFEYLKMYEPQRLKNFMTMDLKILKNMRNKRISPATRSKDVYEQCLKNYEKLADKDLSEITYDEFMPKNLRSLLSGYTTKTNFVQFANEHVLKLIKMDVLKLHSKLGRNYLEYNPNPPKQ